MAPKKSPMTPPETRTVEMFKLPGNGKLHHGGKIYVGECPAHIARALGIASGDTRTATGSTATEAAK